MTYAAGEIVLLMFPFTDVAGAKQRPALILLDTGDADVLVARITSHTAHTGYDVNLTDWQRAGLLRPSMVRIHKLATLEKRLVKRKLGSVTSTDWTRIRQRVEQLCVSITT